MKTVSFEDYHGFMRNNQNLTEKLVEGTEINAMQWVDQDRVVQAQAQAQAQAVYWTTPPGEPTHKTYQIREQQ